MPPIVKKISDIFSTIVVVLIVIITILLVGVRLVGLQVFSVLSGSMEPTYHTGSLIYVKEVEPHELETGDVITYMISEDTVVTHRIAGVVPDSEDPDIWRFRTKGDANDMEDATMVHEANIVGTPVFTIPYLGYLSDYIQNPPGTYYAIAFGALLLMLMFIPDLLEDDKSPKEKPEKTPKKDKDARKQEKKEKQEKDEKWKETMQSVLAQRKQEKQPEPSPELPQPAAEPPKSVERPKPAEPAKPVEQLKPVEKKPTPKPAPQKRQAPPRQPEAPRQVETPKPERTPEEEARRQAALQAARKKLARKLNPNSPDFDFDLFLEMVKRDLDKE